MELTISNTLTQKFRNLGYKTWELLAIIVGPQIQLSSFRSLEPSDLLEKLGG